MSRQKFMTTVKNVAEEKEKTKKLKSLIGFLNANKIDNYNAGWGVEKKYPKESAEQIKKNKNNKCIS